MKNNALQILSFWKQLKYSSICNPTNPNQREAELAPIELYIDLYICHLLFNSYAWHNIFLYM